MNPNKQKLYETLTKMNIDSELLKLLEQMDAKYNFEENDLLESIKTISGVAETAQINAVKAKSYDDMMLEVKEYSKTLDDLVEQYNKQVKNLTPQ